MASPATLDRHVAYLLDAFATIAVTSSGEHAVLIHVGSRPLESWLRERANRPDLARMRVLHWGAAATDVPALVGRFDIAVAPYLPVDQFYFHPLKVVEDLAAGRPVI